MPKTLKLSLIFTLALMIFSPFGSQLFASKAQILAQEALGEPEPTNYLPKKGAFKELLDSIPERVERAMKLDALKNKQEMQARVQRAKKSLRPFFDAAREIKQYIGKLAHRFYYKFYLPKPKE